jgi:hypothetical protein
MTLSLRLPHAWTTGSGVADRQPHRRSSSCRSLWATPHMSAAFAICSDLQTFGVASLAPAAIAARAAKFAHRARPAGRLSKSLSDYGRICEVFVEC